MTDHDEQIRTLLVESLDAELGRRLDGPSSMLRTGRPRSWVKPALVAAVVALIAVAATVVANVARHHRAAPVTGIESLRVTCASTHRSAVPDRATLLRRAEAVSSRPPTVRIVGSRATIDVSGVTAGRARTICASTAVAFRPVIAPTQRAVAPESRDALSRLQFAAPRDEAEYTHLSSAQRLAVDHAIAHSTCTGPSAVRCLSDGTRVLLEKAVVQGRDVVSASPIAPQAGTKSWSVGVKLDRRAGQVWYYYTAAHHADESSATSVLDCGVASVPCADFVAQVVGQKVVSIPVTISSISAGADTMIAGQFDRSAAKQLASQLTGGSLRVPLRLVGVAPLR